MNTRPFSSHRAVRMHPADNVVIIAQAGGLAAGTQLEEGPTLLQAIPQGHKTNLHDLAAGDPIRRYNVVIAYAKQDLPAGSWLEESVLSMPSAPELEQLPMALPQLAPEPLDGYTFEGFRNDDGSVGTRNILAISSTVQCVSGVIDHAVKRIKQELLPRFPYVDDVISLEHVYGCGVAIQAPDAVIPIRTLRNLAKNPNFGGRTLLISLGCEKMQADVVFPERFIPIAQGGFTNNSSTTDLICLQDDEHVGFESMIDTILQAAEKHLHILNQRRRQTCPASDLVVGVQCGGSDAFSGFTANPVVGFASDLLVRAGATVMFSEVSEVRDGIAQLTSRAATPEVAQQLIEQMQWYDEYLKRGHVDRSANTSPGNKRGGLSNIVEKAMGSIVKSGTAPISGVIAPGERYQTKGLNFAATPASDFVCGTLQLAAGMTMHVFTTGRGTPYGLAEVPVIKVATRTDLARRWHDLMDINAGRVADGQASIEEMGWELFHAILAIASGQQKSCAEQLKLHNSLALFNPAPIT